ncbi:PREDICTED: uncharacterized protein LOC105367765 isoform X2 [Ceratosolen solmsi marchali]|uniref:Uncharacterized protein LOC105367765 isoform X2 n=1 Tax=Ceratosolen solmsi marchali TaxID=326594 RepID=A0AAJ6YUZ9_9HYME|nr:PREDICTED: uncharacterized protein LOC105367765 isoform X2 [Ceratosolen solmsi marchali]
MGSSRPSDRFIGEATFLPQWMKGKLDTRFDYTDSTFSPPADDNFFYIRYPKQEATSTPSTTNSNEGFISINKLFGNGPKVVVANSIKSKQHSDDEFRNEKITESSRSIVYVANQIMSCKFGKFNTSEASSSAANQNQANELPTQQQRKGSKSLPVTPIASPSVSPDSSPKSRRRQRLFHESERGRNGWLLSSILGQSRELIAPKIAEEDEQQMEQIPQRALSRKKSISSQNLTYFGTEDKATGNKEVAASSTTHLNLLQAKPSEFREMNFWSPTSM